MADYTLSAKVTGDASGFQRAFQSATRTLEELSNKTKNVSKKISELGKNISDFGDTLTSKITKPAAAATTALVGLTLVKGFDRLVGIDTARAKLKGLGHDAEAIESIMESALASVRGTAFGLDEAATTAANAVAAGIPPGKELTRYLKLTADTAAIAGASLSEIGAILNKVTTSGRAYNGELQMLSDRGLPVYQWLAEEANTTADAIFDMASKGQISTDMLLNAIEKNIGGAAKIMGEESFSAAIANIGADIARIGANFLDAGGKAGGFFSTVKPLLTEFRGYLAQIEEKAADWGVAFGNAFNRFIDGIRQLKARFDELDPSVQSLILKAVGIGAAVAVGIGPALKFVGFLTTSFGGLVSAVSFLVSPIGLVIAALAGLAAIFGRQMIVNEEFRNNVINVFSAVRDKIVGVVQAVLPLLQSAGEFLRDAFKSIGENIIKAFETIKGIIDAVAPVFFTFFKSIIDGFQSAGVTGGGFGIQLASILLGLTPIIKGVITLFQNFGPQIVSAFKSVAGMVLPLVANIGMALGEIAAAVIPVLMSTLQTLIPVVVQVGTAFMNIVQMVLPALISLVNQLLPIITEIVIVIAQTAAQMMPLVGVLIGSLLPVITSIIIAVTNIVRTVAPAVIAIVGAIMEVIQALLPVIMSIITVVVNVVSNVISVISPIVAFVAGIITAIMAVISPIISFVAGIISNVIAVIRPIISVVTGIFNTVFSVISGVFRNIASFIGSVINGISTVIGGISSVVSGVFNTVFGIVKKIMNKVSDKITGVFSAVQGAWSGLTGFVSNVFDGISTSVQKLVDQVKKFINKVIGGINSAIGLINKIPGVNISKIPYLARGTDDWQGGFAYINEGGRGELVHLPDGSQVIPHDVSMRYAREAARERHRSTTISNPASMFVDTRRIESLLEKIANSEGVVVLDSGELVGKTYHRYDRFGGNHTRLQERWD